MTGAPRHPAAALAGLRIVMTLDAVGGVWRHAMDLAAGLRAGGCDIVFAGFGPPPDAAMLAEAARHGAIGWVPAPLDWMAAGPEALRPARAGLEAICRDHRADLLHLNAPPLAAGASLALPVVAMAHSCLATWHRAVRGGPLPPDLAWTAEAALRGYCAADAVVAPSCAQAAAMRACHGGALPRVGVVHNAVAAHPPPGPSTGAGAGRAAFALAAGRWWDEGKGGATADAAAAAMSVPMRLAGPLDGPNGTRFAPRHAEALGPLPHAALRRLMAEAAAFVAPGRYEPFGLAVAEAAQAGLPLVLADIPTYRELWPPEAADFVAPGDAAGFARAVDALLADPARAARMGAEARAHAARYRPARQLAAMVKVYRAALGRPRLLPRQGVGGRRALP